MFRPHFSIRFITFLAILAASLILTAGLGASQNESQLTPPPKPGSTGAGGSGNTNRGPLVPGETLSYYVSWGTFTTAARLDLEVVDQGSFFGQDGYQLRARVNTTGSVRSVFQEIDNQYTTYVQGGTLLPHRIETSIRQGVRSSEDLMTIDQQGRQARFADDSQRNLSGETYDLVSLFYALRTKGFASGSKGKLFAIYGRELVELDIKVQDRARITTPTGTYNAVRVEIDPKDQSKYKTQVWFSDDAQKLPVLITAKLPFGEVRAELSGVSYNPRPKPIWTKEKYTEGPKGAGEKYAEVEKSRPFGVGERIAYNVSWGSFATVGKASFSVRQRGRIGSRSVMELAGEASTTGLARGLIEVEDEMISVVDAATLAPLRTETRLREGKRRKQIIADYNWSDGTVKLTNGTHFRIPAQTLDLVSLFYAVRASPLQPGGVSNFSLLDANHRPLVLTFKTAKVEQIGSQLGNLPAIQVDVLREKDLVAQVWVSNDARRIPLYLALKTRFGELRFYVSSASGLR
jgi:hypothetical protein